MNGSDEVSSSLRPKTNELVCRRKERRNCPCLKCLMKTSRQMTVILKALAEPRRVAILTLVRSRDELRAGEIAKRFRTTRPGISQHLRVLTNAGLLCERRQGTSRLYSLRREGFGDLRAFLDSFWEESLSRLKQEVEKEARERTRPLIRSVRPSSKGD